MTQRVFSGWSIRLAGLAAMSLTPSVVSAQPHALQVNGSGDVIGCTCGQNHFGSSVDSPPVSDFRYFSDPFDRWFGDSNAAGFTGVQGDPITLTYGIVPDGTAIGQRANQPASESTGPSNLVAFLNNNVGPQSTWLPLIQDAYGRWGELSGLTMVYEANDDGAQMGPGGAPGVDNVRADMRIGGRFIDGQSGSNTLAYNYSPNSGDHVVDTSNSDFYSNANNNYRGFRNVFMHEAGHGLGFAHHESFDSQGLMEPFISTSFDGPQLDDILAVQRNYGDALEANGGNNSFNNATALGSLTPVSITDPVSELRIGSDASDTSNFVAANATDFVSIDGTSDRDAYGFTLTADGEVTLQLDPRGPTYFEGPQGGTQTPLNTKALADLALSLLDAGGNAIASGNLFGAGFGETISMVLAAGDYFAVVRTQAGSDDNVQLYELAISAVVIPEPGTVMVLLGGATLTLLRRRTA